MNGLKKTWWIFGLVLVLVGLVLASVSWAMGGSGSSVFLDKDGLHVSRDVDEVYTETSQMDLAEFKSVGIRTVAADIEFVESDKFGFEARIPSAQDEIEWSLENGVLKVGEQDDNDWGFQIFDMNFGGPEHYVKIYYPRDTEFERVETHTTSGNVKMNAVKVKELKSWTTSGDIRVDEIASEQVDLGVVSGEIKYSGVGLENVATMKLRTTSGDIEVRDVAWRDLSAESVSGSVRLAGAAQGPTSAKSISGNVRVTLDGERGDYAYQINTLSGTIRVAGDRVGDPANYTVDRPVAELKLRTTSGDVSLDWE